MGIEASLTTRRAASCGRGAARESLATQMHTTTRRSFEAGRTTPLRATLPLIQQHSRVTTFAFFEKPDPVAVERKVHTTRRGVNTITWASGEPSTRKRSYLSASSVSSSMSDLEHRFDMWSQA